MFDHWTLNIDLVVGESQGRGPCVNLSRPPGSLSLEIRLELAEHRGESRQLLICL